MPMPKYRCYHCFVEVNDVDHQRALAVQHELESRFADTDYGEGLAETNIDNVHCRPSADQQDAKVNVVFCSGCVITMIFDGLRLGRTVHV